MKKSEINKKKKNTSINSVDDKLTLNTHPNTLYSVYDSFILLFGNSLIQKKEKQQIILDKSKVKRV